MVLSRVCLWVSMAQVTEMELVKQVAYAYPDDEKREQMEEQTWKEEEKQKRQLGGIKTMPFILGEFQLLFLYVSDLLTQQLNLPLVEASNTLTNFGGTASFTPLLGALIADSFAGQFWTITVGSIFYGLGLITVFLTALLPSLHPPPCPSGENCKEASTLQLWVLYLALLLTALGTGGLRPCVVTFAAYQFDMKKESVASRRWNFFNWFYFSMGIATLTALTVIVYIQENVGWDWGFGIPTGLMAFSIVVFVSGYPLYKKLKPAGSPLVRLVQVVVAAAKKRKARFPEDPGLLYQNKDLDAGISTDGRLLHTNQFKWVDKAAVVTSTDSDPPNLWRLATVHRVEELKSIVRMLPIWAAGILIVTSSSHLGSFVITQARSMNRRLSPSFEIPPASMSIFSNLTMLVGLFLYERLFVPFARKFSGNPSGITCLQRMGIGYVINIFATIVSALVEIKRKQVAARYHLLDNPHAIIPISVFWLVPQYCIHGIAEVFINVGHMEFLLRLKCRWTSTVLVCSSIILGHLLLHLLVSQQQEGTSRLNNIDENAREPQFLDHEGMKLQAYNELYSISLIDQRSSVGFT